MPSLSSTQKRIRCKRHTLWYRTFSGCLFLFALSCGIAGAVVGGIMGVLECWTSNGSNSWLSGIALNVAAHLLVTALLGVFVGLAVFVVVAGASGRWSARRKWRFAHDLNTGFFLPMTAITVIIPIIATLCWLFHQGGFSPNPNGWEGFLMRTELLTILLAPLPLMGRLMYLSKASISKQPLFSERLLPLD